MTLFMLGGALWAAMAAQATLDLQPASARPGDAISVFVRGVDAAPTGTLQAQALTFLSAKGGFRALTGLSVDQKPGRLSVVVKTQDGQELKGFLEVVSPNFNQRTLKVSPKYTSPPASVKRWMEEDKMAFAEAFARFEPRWLFEDDFAWPTPTQITAPFGDLRLFNGKKKSQHFGTDLDGKVGDPVQASQAGQVVMRRECYAAGNTVLVHHGGNLFTAYFHLSRFDVEVGQVVTRGQLVGAVGKTGRVTGPHLHFGVKIDGRWVDAESVLRLKLGPVSDPSTSEVASPEMR